LTYIFRGKNVAPQVCLLLAPSILPSATLPTKWDYYLRTSKILAGDLKRFLIPHPLLLLLLLLLPLRFPR
jgi:hypothetical protein